MGVLDSIASYLSSIRIEDDLYQSSRDTSPVPVERRRAPAIRDAHHVTRSLPAGRSTRPQPRERTPRDLDDLKKENATLKRRQERLEKELASARRHAEHYRDRRASSEKKKALTETKNKELEVIITNLRESYEAELESLRLKNEAYAATHPRTASPFVAPTTQPGDAELRRQLEERSEEIKALRLLLDETDDMPMTALAEMVKDLNSEIVGIAASITDDVHFIKPWETEDPWALDVSDEFLPTCLQMLTGELDHAADPTLVQLSLQAWIVHSVAAVFNRFYFGLPEDEDSVLMKVFTKLQKEEMQAVSLRWRALAITHAKSASEDFDASFRRSVKALTDKTVDGLETILRFAGARPPVMSRRTSLLASVKGSIVGDVFDRQVEATIERASRLATTIAERIRSIHCEIVTEDGGRPESEAVIRAEQASRIVEEKEEGANEEKTRTDGGTDKVVCAVGFGLRCTSFSKRASSPHGVDESGTGTIGTHEPQPSQTSTVVIRPAPLLSSTVDMLKKNLIVS